MTVDLAVGEGAYTAATTASNTQLNGYESSVAQKSTEDHSTSNGLKDEAQPVGFPSSTAQTDEGAVNDVQTDAVFAPPKASLIEEIPPTDTLKNRPEDSLSTIPVVGSPLPSEELPASKPLSDAAGGSLEVKDASAIVQDTPETAVKPEEAVAEEAVKQLNDGITTGMAENGPVQPPTMDTADPIKIDVPNDGIAPFLSQANGVSQDSVNLVPPESDLRTIVNPVPRPSEPLPNVSDLHGTQVASPPLELKTAVAEDVPHAEQPPPQVSSNETSIQQNPQTTGLPKDQQKFALAVIRSLKRHPDAPPFSLPVDPIAQGVPDYPKYIKTPMDISTVEKKLQSKMYSSTSDFAEDMRLIFANCYRFNGMESPISKMAKNVEEVFEKQLAKMPVVPVVAEPAPSPLPAEPAATAPKRARQESISVPAIRRSPSDGRPRREIHPPAPKDLPWALENEQVSGKKRRNDSRQMRFCRSVLHEMLKKTHETYAFPFYNPVDAVALNLPDYHKVIKFPMDLSTIRKKLDAGAYPNPESFEGDMQLMFKNCFRYNPPGSVVNDYGKSLEAVFKRKWAEKPDENSEETYAEESDASDHGATRHKHSHSQISELEKQLEMMRSKIHDLKASSTKERRPSHSKTKSKSGKVSKTSRDAATRQKKSPKKRRKHGDSSDGGDQSEDENAPISFEQKRVLSEKINSLPENRLASVVALIHEEMPHLAAEGGEIELEIEQLNNRTLNRLYRMVVRNKSKSSSGSRHASKKHKSSSSIQRTVSTGKAKKRQILDEKEQLRQIQALEQKLKHFESGGNAPEASKESSGSESGDDSSGVSTGDESGSESG